MASSETGDEGAYLDFGRLAAMQRYKILSSIVVPRPIAWVTTRNEATGVVNAAPYSFFNVFCEEPPLVILGLQHDDDANPKDTAYNIRENGEFVVNIVRESMFGAMVASAAAVDRDVSETKLLRLDVADSRAVRVPRIVGAPAALECVHERTLELTTKRDLVVGRVLGVWTEPGLVDTSNNHVDWNDDFPVGRLYADRYARIKDSEDLRSAIPSAEQVLSRNPAT